MHLKPENFLLNFSTMRFKASRINIKNLQMFKSLSTLITIADLVLQPEILEEYLLIIIPNNYYSLILHIMHTFWIQVHNTIVYYII